jgi:hypothetical protein
MGKKKNVKINKAIPDELVKKMMKEGDQDD